MSEIAESFASSLSELTVNSKPHINMLTMLAEDHVEFAPIITQTVLSHLQKVRPEVKLPVLYLIDSIVKNVGKTYINLFTQSIVQSFTNTFEKVDEKTREQMFKLRQTWNDVFPSKTMYALDTKVQQIDPAWPCTAPSTVHLNPKFFKADILDSKSLSSKQPGMAQIETRSRHRKNKSYNPRSRSVTHSSRSKKASPTNSASVESVPGTKPSPAPEKLREQMIMKQKMLLELQQQKLKLELLQTQAQLEEQQKQLEKQSVNHKTSSSELVKLQQIVTQEEAKLKIMSKNLKKQVNMKFPKLQQIHRATNDMKTQKVSDVHKLGLGSETPSLLKPAALLELSKDDVSLKPSKPAPPKDSKSKITQLQHIERQKLVTPAEPTEEAPPPVRIAPVSTQLINAALSFGRNVRDPRLRQQMTSRLENQHITPVTHPSPNPTPIPASISNNVLPAKKSEPQQDTKLYKTKKDKKPSNHSHKEKPRHTDEENRSHSRSSSRSSDRSSSKSSGKAEKTSPSKRSEEKSDRKSKIEDLFSSSRSKSPTPGRNVLLNQQSPSKSHSRRDQTNISEHIEHSTKTLHTEKISRIESSPKRSKVQEAVNEDSNIEVMSGKLVQSLSLDITKAQSVTTSDVSKANISPEPVDSSAEMLDEDIEKIVKHPGIVPKVSKLPEMKSKIQESQESLKSSDDSIEEHFDEIVKNPTKQIKLDKLSNVDKIGNVDEDKLKATHPVIHDTLIKKISQEMKDTIKDDVQQPATSDSPADSYQNITISKEKVQVEIPEDHFTSKPDSDIQRILTPAPPTYMTKDPRVYMHSLGEEKECDMNVVPDDSTKQESQLLTQASEQEIVPSTVNPIPEFQHNMSESFIQEEVVSTETSLPEYEEYVPSNVDKDQSNLSGFKRKLEEPITTPVQESPSVVPQMDTSAEFDSLKPFERVLRSPNRTHSPIKNIEPMETVQETNENSTPTDFPSQSKAGGTLESPPVQQETRMPKGDKPSIAEQMIDYTEKHETSPSPSPPPIISDKFKEIKQSSLSRLRRVGRPRDELADSESPEPADVDLRTQIQPLPVTKDPKNEVLALADKDVDLRNLPSSPTKKRPSMEKLLDIPPAKKSKAEVMDELFGSEDVDLRPVLCPPPPSPPPPPVISISPPPESAGERLWARYKQTKPDTYKTKYTPSRRDRAPSVDKFGHHPRYSGSEASGWQARGRTYPEDVDMRAQPPGGADGSYNHIIMQAFEQHKRGDLNDDAYKRVLSEVFTMREKRQLEEAQRRDKEEAAQAENLEPISDDDISGGSLSGVEDAPSPTASYSGTEDIDEPSVKVPTTDKQPEPSVEHEVKPQEHVGDVDIRLPSADVDIRVKLDFQPRVDIDGKPTEEKLSRTSRGMSPYNRKSNDEEKDRYRKSQRREKRLRRSEEEREPRYRKARYSQETWGPHERRAHSPSEKMDVDAPAPRVPPIAPHYDDSHSNYREMPLSIHAPRFEKDFPPEQHNSPPMRPPAGPWEPQRPTPWMPGMAPLIRGPGPPVMGMRPPQDRFMPPRWRQPVPGAIFEGEPNSRFSRFGPPPIGRFPVPLPPCEVPPSDPAVLKLIEEDPTKSINIDGVSRDIRFYGQVAVAFMGWDDPREVSFQPGQRLVIIDDRDSVMVHFNAPPVEVFVDGKPHRVRFGAPTRELYIDNQWFEVFFGGPPVKCDIGGKPHSVKLEGPPPPVRPGAQRKDLVVGKITLIIDAEYLFTVYLDAKPQKFEVKGVPYIIRFVEALQKTVINGVAFKSDFGGLPRPIILNGSKHFFRLTALPRGVTPGYLTIVNMEGGRLPSPPTLPAPPQLPASLEQAVDFKPDLKSDPFPKPPMPVLTAPPRVSPEVPRREVEAPLLPTPALMPPVTSAPAAQVIQPPPVIPLDMLTTLMPAPAPEPSSGADYSYSVDNENSNQAMTLTTTTATTTTSTTSTSAAPTSTGEINVAELLQRLMATGIVPTLEQPKDKNQDKPVTTDSNIIKPVDFRKPETLKTRQTALISHLYSGIQCNSCGVRFPPEQTMKYSQHLDWHFRQNRRDKDSSRTAQTRRYYYDVNDWVQFEEIEDLEERAQPWFEMNEEGVEEEVVPTVLVSVRAADYPDDADCQICHDKFESFYNEEKEEWQLRNAVDHEGKLVHPVCLEDQRAAAEKPIIVEDIDITGDDKEEEVEKKEEEPPKVEEVEDDDIMEVTDIEFVNPVFPVEDLTVSDSESVADNNEEKADIVEEEKKETEKMNVEESSEAKEPTPSEVIKDDVQGEMKAEDNKVEKEESAKDEDTQDDLVVLEKGEDSAPSNAEIMEVVRNIKKDPDALGGEYEEIALDPDVGIKKEKSEVPLPAPVVDTTHASVTTLIDGNVEFEETPHQMNVGGPPKIKINITKPIVQSVTKEPKESELEIVDSEAPNSILPATLALVTQPPPPGEEPVPQHIKPRLIGRKLQDLPPVLKGSELSGLCSIM